MKIKWILFLFVLGAMAFPAAAQENKVFKESEITDSLIEKEFSKKKECVRNQETGECIRTRQFVPTLIDQADSPSEETASLSILITFATNSAELTQSARRALDIMGRSMNKFADSDFIVEGHADLSGSYELNQRLSKARAESVMSYLVREHGVERNRLKAIGKGYTELLNTKNPVAPENRRVTFIRIVR